MGRINVAADEQIVKELEAEAKRRGYTMYSLTNAALKLTLKVLKEGEDLSIIESLLEFYRISKNMSIVPVTAWYLDSISISMYQNDREGFEKICRDAGEQLGAFLRLRARSLDELLEVYESVKPVLPISNIMIRPDNGGVEVQVSGSGFSRESTICASQVLTKVVEAFGMKVTSIVASPGGIIIARVAFNPAQETRV